MCRQLLLLFLLFPSSRCAKTEVSSPAKKIRNGTKYVSPRALSIPFFWHMCQNQEHRRAYALKRLKKGESEKGYFGRPKNHAPRCTPPKKNPNPYLNAYDNSNSDERIGNWRKKEGGKEAELITKRKDGRTWDFFIGTNGKPK